MEKVSYIEFRRPVPLKPAWLFYILEWIMLLLVSFILQLLLDNICFKEDSRLLFLWIDIVLVASYFVLVEATNSVRIYSNGEICRRYLGISKRFNANKVSKIRYSQYKSLFSTYYKITIEMTDHNTIEVFIDDYRLFYDVLSEYNPNIELIKRDKQKKYVK